MVNSEANKKKFHDFLDQVLRAQKEKLNNEQAAFNNFMDLMGAKHQ
jgi:hypothetical protein